MSERIPPSRSPEWDFPAIAEVLAGTGEPLPDPVAGNVWRFRIGRPPGTELELFPAAGVVRVATPDVHVALVRQDPPALESSGGVFARTGDAATSRLVVAPGGAITPTLAPRIPRRRADIRRTLNRSPRHRRARQRRSRGRRDGI